MGVASGPFSASLVRRIESSVSAGIGVPCVGTAPDIAGKGIANPTAVMLAGAMLLEHIGERTAAEKLATAIREAIASKEATTRDLGGNATSRMFTNAVLKRLR